MGKNKRQAYLKALERVMGLELSLSNYLLSNYLRIICLELSAVLAFPAVLAFFLAFFAGIEAERSAGE